MSTTAPSAAVLSVQDLHFSWPQGPLFQGLSFDLPPGVSQLLGDEGAGKTTLLKLLAGELAAASGQLFLNGLLLAPGTAPWRQQVFWIDPQTDAHDALVAAAYLDSLARRYPTVQADRLGALIDGFGLQPHLDKPLYMLSTGSKRKVWLSAALAAGAPLTLIDQPFAALDAPSIRFLLQQLQQFQAEAGPCGRACVLADYSAAEGLTLARQIEL